MKKLLCILGMVTALLAGCSTNKIENDKLKIVTTIYPEYDWVKNIVGDNENVEIKVLLNNGSDLHSYQPTAEDILNINEADLFIYNGGESDEWIEDILSQNPNINSLNLMEALGDKVKTEESVEGMQSEEESDEEEYDEHIWLSLKNAQVLTKAINEKLDEIDSEHKNIYDANTKTYCEKLASLDSKYEELVNNASNKTILFGDRFPFRYLVDDYGLTYYAAFSGCSAETEASFETVIFLANKVDELNLNVVLTIDKSDSNIASTIVENTKNKNQKILELNSMQSTTTSDNTSYLEIMENNLEVLKQALN